MEETTRPTITQLEKLLQQDDQISLTILPNGEVSRSADGVNTGELKPVTFRENLGGEYTGKRKRFADGFTAEQMREEYAAAVVNAWKIWKAI